jgi:hypothetical protein
MLIDDQQPSEPVQLWRLVRLQVMNRSSKLPPLKLARQPDQLKAVRN